MSLEIKAKSVENRRDDAAGIDGTLGRESADGIALADDFAAFDAASGKRAGETLGPVIASAGRIDLGRAPEFAETGDEDVVEHAALEEILEQGRVGLIIHGRDLLFHLRHRDERLRPVDVPGEFVEDGEESIHRDEAHPVLNETAREQETLPDPVHPVTLAHGQGLLREVEGGAGFFTRHEPKGGMEILIEETGILARLE